MQIVATTNGGVLISATNDEVSAIICSTSGVAPKELAIGQKIPAIDYAGSITKLKSLKGAYGFRSLCDSVERFAAEFTVLKGTIENAAAIE